MRTGHCCDNLALLNLAAVKEHLAILYIVGRRGRLCTTQFWIFGVSVHWVYAGGGASLDMQSALPSIQTVVAQKQADQTPDHFRGKTPTLPSSLQHYPALCSTVQHCPALCSTVQQSLEHSSALSSTLQHSPALASRALDCSELVGTLASELNAASCSSETVLFLSVAES